MSKRYWRWAAVSELILFTSGSHEPRTWWPLLGWLALDTAFSHLPFFRWLKWNK